MWEEGEHTLESCGRMGTEVKPLDLPGKGGSEGFGNSLSGTY